MALPKAVQKQADDVAAYDKAVEEANAQANAQLQPLKAVSSKRNSRPLQ
jgi:hypothetical protein